MPIYEYSCEGCQQVFEKMQKISDSGSITCPHCGTSSTKRLVSRTSFQLKGTGWYQTDYKKPCGSSGGGVKASDPSQCGALKESVGANETGGCGGGVCATGEKK